MKQAVISAFIVLIVVGGYFAISGALYGADGMAILLVFFALGIPFAMAGLTSSLLADWLAHRGMPPLLALYLAGCCSAGALLVLLIRHPLTVGPLMGGAGAVLAFIVGCGGMLAGAAAVSRGLCRCLARQ